MFRIIVSGAPYVTPIQYDDPLVGLIEFEDPYLFRMIQWLG